MDINTEPTMDNNIEPTMDNKTEPTMEEDKREAVEAYCLEMQILFFFCRELARMDRESDDIDLEAQAILATIFEKIGAPRRTVEGYIKGGADEVENVAYLKAYRRYRTMEAAANRLQKESKGYLDSLRGMFVLVDLPEQR
jgi:hypothetical protein